MENEIWKDIIGWESIYQVSDLGRVKSLPRIMKHKGKYDRLYPENILKLSKNTQGYMVCTLLTMGVKKTALVHRLVAEALIDNPENKPMVNHKDGDKTNNMKSNLEWNTGGENNLHAYKTGLKLTKAVIQYSKAGDLIKEWDSIREVENTLEINNTHISSTCKGNRKSAGGFIWKYKSEVHEQLSKLEL
jgi:hypothetical protein